jgi:hypothetical protein
VSDTQSVRVAVVQAAALPFDCDAAVDKVRGHETLGYPVWMRDMLVRSPRERVEPACRCISRPEGMDTTVISSEEDKAVYQLSLQRHYYTDLYP